MISRRSRSGGRSDKVPSKSFQPTKPFPGPRPTPLQLKPTLDQGDDLKHIILKILVTIALLVAVSTSGICEEGSSPFALGFGTGRHYGGLGFWGGYSLTNWFGGTASLGSTGYDRIGWEIGVQVYSSPFANRFLLRATGQYGSEGQLFEIENGSKVLRGQYEGLGFGVGIGCRAGRDHYFLLDCWKGTSGIPSGYFRDSRSPLFSIGLVGGFY